MPRELEPVQLSDGWLVPVLTVGVQGDSRTYRGVLAIDGQVTHERATELINQHSEINRVVTLIGSRAPITKMRTRISSLTPDRLARLRQADAIVRRISDETGFEQKVWQFPVITIPFGTADAPDSVVLRPVDSVDGMTAQSVEIPPNVLGRMSSELMALQGISAVFHDLTHKPPGTIEWE